MKIWKARKLNQDEPTGYEAGCTAGKLRSQGRLAKMFTYDLHGRVNSIGILVVPNGFVHKPMDKVILKGYDLPPMEVEYAAHPEGQMHEVTFRPVHHELPKAKFAVGTHVKARFDYCIGHGTFAFRRGAKGVVTECVGNRVTVRISGDDFSGPASDWAPIPEVELLKAQRQSKRENAKLVAGLHAAAKTIRQKNRLLYGQAPDFPDRVVLGEGHPWATGLGNKQAPYYSIMVLKKPIGVAPKKLTFPKALWNREVPKYRLVLERV